MSTKIQNAHQLVGLSADQLTTLPDGAIAGLFLEAVKLKQKTCISHDNDRVYLPSCAAVSAIYDRLGAEIARRGKTWELGMFGGDTWLADAAGTRTDQAGG